MEIKAAEVKLVYMTKVKPSDRYVVKNSRDAYELLLKFYDEETIELKEFFKVILLNQRSKVLGVHNLGEGGIGGVYVDIKQIIQLAILTNSTNIVVSHNHPSGDPHPSQIDMNLTNSIKEACKALKITLIDHIIVTPHDYYSFTDECKL